MADMTKAQQRQKRTKGAYYKVQFGRTDANKKRRLRKHVRNNPRDEQNEAIYVKQYGKPSEPSTL